MELKLIFITNDPETALLCEQAGVDRIMVDLEVVGKKERQIGRDTLISYHSIDDVSAVRNCIDTSDLLVRINPFSNNTKNEIDTVIAAGANSIMLPMADDYTTVLQFSNIVSNRAKKVLLLETIPALVRAYDLCQSELVDEVHIGLNDMHIDARLDFMFELMSSHVLDSLCSLLTSRGIPFGIGGVAPLSQKNILQAGLILDQHARLGSSQVIMSRSFKNILSAPDALHLMRSEVSDLKMKYKASMKQSDIDRIESLCNFRKCISNITSK